MIHVQKTQALTLSEDILFRNIIHCKAVSACSHYAMFVCSEYVQLYVDYLLNKSIQSQFQAFYHGFHSVCASNALIVSPPFTFSPIIGPMSVGLGSTQIHIN